METISDKELQIESSKALENGYGKAKEMLDHPDKIEKLLNKLEKKLKSVPNIGEKLSHIPVFVSLIRSYIKKEYTEIPLGTIIAVLSALIYFVSPVDIIPDVMPVIGFADDAAVIAACLKLVDTDIEEYIEWRDANSDGLIYDYEN